jgi:5-oxoprolinase (ATP-hydrolysing) subunit A
MAVPVVDLNADVGEGVTDDEGLLAVVTSANVACGFHAGDAATMRRVCEGAAERGVVVGAQVSYRDRAGFGRRDIEVVPSQLIDDVLEQIAELSRHASAAGTKVSYVKPHGALYNRSVSDEECAGAVVDAVVGSGGLPVLGLPGSQLLAVAREHGLPAVEEAFADRAYTVGGTLVARGSDGAVLTDLEAIAARAVQIATTGRVDSIDGPPVRTPARSICVHGDTPGAVAIARRVRAALASAGVTVRAFA